MSCEDNVENGPRVLPPGPWRARKVALDGNMLLRFISGETLIVEHVPMPQDAVVIGSFQNGIETVLYVESETFDLCKCLCNMPTKRINYSTGD
jgi:hypothetical protein